MNFVDIMKDILVYAPTIAKGLWGDDSALILKLLAEIFDVLDGDHDALHAAIESDPAREDKLKRIEEAYKNSGNAA